MYVETAVFFGVVFLIFFTFAICDLRRMLIFSRWCYDHFPFTMIAEGG